MFDDKINRFNDSYTSVSRLNEYGNKSKSPHVMQVSNNANCVILCYDHVDALI